MPAAFLATLLCLACLTGAWAAPASGRVWTVNPEGTGDAASIAEAFAVAATGDIVELAPGTYTGLHVLEAKGLTLVGRDGPSVTTLDGENAGRILTLLNTSFPVTVRGISFTRGFVRNSYPGNVGGAIGAFGSPLVVEDCRFESNFASGGRGGAVYCTFWPYSDPNGAVEPDGERSAAAAPADRHYLEVTRCVFTDNFSGDEGGALHADEAASIVRDCEFLNNRSVNGGALSMLSRSHVVERCLFVGNHARLDGGGLYYEGGGSLSLADLDFRDNSAERRGGGVRVLNPFEVILSRCLFIANTSPEGGGLNAQRTMVTANRVLWWNNSADTGGGVHLLESPQTLFTRCTWMGNTAATAPSFIMREGLLAVTESVFADEGEMVTLCTDADLVNNGCNLGGPDTRGCFAFADRVEVELCADDPFAVCALPQVEPCGPVGHAERTCQEACAVTPVEAVSWGRLKTRY